MGIGLNAQTVPAAVSSFKLDYKLTTVKNRLVTLSVVEGQQLAMTTEFYGKGCNLEQVRKPTNKSMFESREKGSIRHCTI